MRRPTNHQRILTPCVLCMLGLASALLPSARAQEASFPQTLRQAQEKSGKKEWAAAAPLWEKVTAANPVNADFWEEYAMALYSGKQYRPAIPAFEKALELRASFPFNQAYNIACCYALLKEKEPALTWLQRSLDLGFRDLAHIRTDQDLKSLREDERFRKIAGVIDTSKMNRVDGWRADLAFLYREIKRKHYNPYRYYTREQMEEFIRKLDAEIPSLDDEQITVKFMELVRMVGDGHTDLYPAKEEGISVQFYLFPEGLYIVGALPSQAELLGARVLKIGNHPVEEAMKAVEPLIFRDNTMWIKNLGPKFLRWPGVLYGLGLIDSPKELPLTIIDASGKERAITLPADAGHPNDSWESYAKTLPGPLPLYLKNRREPYWFEYLPEQKTVYFQYNAVRETLKEPLAKFCDRLFKFVNDNPVEKLVVDLRWNGGGNTFLNEPIIHGLIKCEKINQKGKLFAIIGRQTFSAAQNCSVFIERHTKAIFVGEPTGSSPNFVGETVAITLPYSRMRGSISDLFWESSWPMDYRTWLPPTLYAPPTFADFKAQRDPALEAILAYRNEG